MKLTRLLVLACTLTLTLSGYFYTNKSTAQSSVMGEASARVSATITAYQFRIFGYTSPQAQVTIEGNGTFETTTADETGFFLLAGNFSPLSYSEPCITARDEAGRTSVPQCLAPFTSSRNITIGPVILPPTVSINGGVYYVGNAAIMSGQTIPNTPVTFSFFTDQTKNNSMTSAFSLVRRVDAFSIPQFEAVSDKNGFFTLSIPTNDRGELRTFARASFQGKKDLLFGEYAQPPGVSAKSNTIHYEVKPWWMILFTLIGSAINAIGSRLIELAILAQLMVGILFILSELHPHALVKSRALARREILPPAIPPPHSLMRLHSIEGDGD